MRALGLAAIALVLAGCASAVGLDVAYPAAGVNRALLASAAPRRVALAPVTDYRRDARIGIEPESKKDIVTRRPASEIVREALALELDANGHTVTAAPADAVLAAAVEEFRLDIAKGYRSTQYVGKVVIALAVTDGRTGQLLLDRRYIGINRREADPEAESAPRDTMDTALARAMHDLATDPELVRALARVSTAAR